VPRLTKEQTPLVVHVSQTNVHQDHRILKAMTYGEEAGYMTVAIGFSSTKVGWAAGAINLDNSREIRTLPLIFGRSHRLLRSLSLLCQLIEVNLKVARHLLDIKADIVHCHGFVTLPGVVVAKLFSKRALIYDAHELESSRDGLSRIGRKLIFFVEKALWSQVDGLVVVSPSIREWYRTKVGPKPTELVMNSPIFRQHNHRAARELGVNGEEETLRVGYVGALTSGRSIIEYASSLSGVEGNFRLTFIGEGPLRSQLEELSQADP